jgi:CHAD domain-containing protein
LLLSFADKDHAAKLGATDLAQLEGLLTSARQHALGRAVRETKKLEAARLGKELRAAVKRFCSRAPEDDEALRAGVQERGQRRLQSLLANTPTEESGSELHTLRLRLKKFRYCVELWESLAGRGKGELVKMCAAMQDRLGSWNDHVQAVERITRLGGNSEVVGRQPVWAAAVLGYAAGRAQAADELRREIVAQWPQWSKELAEQVAVLTAEQVAKDSPAQPAEP